MSDINLNSFQKQIQTFMNHIKSTGETQVDEKTFLDKITNDKSIFCMLDQNCDRKISEDEMNAIFQADADNDGIVTDNEIMCMKEMKFFARRNVDKWFTLDTNRDGHWSNVEEKLSTKRMSESDTSLEAAMSNEQLAKLYNMKEKIDDPNNTQLEDWLNGWLNYLKQIAREKYNVELNDKQIIILKNEFKKQLNTWLFKTGDNATGNAPLYNSLNVTAYTRLVTTKDTVSCCGGDIIPPPAIPDKNSCAPVFGSLEASEENQKAMKEFGIELDAKVESGEITDAEATKRWDDFYKSLGLKNRADEVKNRLAWAMYKTPPKEELALTAWDKMNDKEKTMYADCQEILSKMSNEQLEKLLKPENEKECIAFEQQNNISHKDLEKINARTIWVKMSDEQYNNYHQQYQQMRDMKASDFRELLKPENAQKRADFEKNSIMTVQQIVDYIDIVEQQIGVGNFDKEDWSVDSEQYMQISFAINGTAGDESRLKGKTRADVPKNRQALLKFLEEKGWLYEQFK